MAMRSKLIQYAEWVTVPIQETVQRVICRTTNRIFVGSPLCPWPFHIFILQRSESMLISISRPGLWLSDSKFNFRGQCCKVRLHHQLVSETSQVVCNHLYPCFVISTESRFSIVSRMLSNLPSKIQQEIEFIRPMVEERFAKMEEYGEDWDDKDRKSVV